MNDFRNILKKHKNSNILAIFPHPDDESYLVAGLFQIAQKYNIKTHLICLTKGGRGLNGLKNGNLKKIRSAELKRACEILNVDKLYLWDFPDANLKKTKSKWIAKIRQVIKEKRPDIVITFDHSGITGHPDHISSSVEVLKLLRKYKNIPMLFWKVPGKTEKKDFKENKALKYAVKPNYILNVGLIYSLIKIRALLFHKSQIQGIGYVLRILQWYLLNRQEFYYQVDFRKKYEYKFVNYKID